jgi:cytochrome P450
VDALRWYWRFLRNPLECLVAAQRAFGPLFVLSDPISIRRGRRARVFLLAAGAHYNREVLGNPDIYRSGGQVMRGPKGSAHARLRSGLLGMHGEEHRCHRRMMRPPFSKTMVASYVEAMARLIDRRLDSWPVGESIDMFQEMRTLANWVAADLLFGDEDFEASIKVGKAILEWGVLAAAARKFLPWINLPGTPFWRMLRQAETVDRLLRELIDDRRRTKSDAKDLLSIMVRAVDANESGMTDEALAAHLAFLFGASFETSASALTWTFFLLAQHPSAAARLHDEVNAHVTSWPPNVEELDSLPFLDAVLREAMRILPPVPLTVRSPAKPLSLAGVRLGLRDKVVLSHFLTHRDPEVFANPSRFDPERWLTLQPDPYAYIPFSAGPRLCLGYNFAMIEMKLVVARVMQRYRMSVVPKARIEVGVETTTKPLRGMPMTVRRQDGDFASSPIRGSIRQLVELT